MYTFCCPGNQQEEKKQLFLSFFFSLEFVPRRRRREEEEEKRERRIGRAQEEREIQCRHLPLYSLSSLLAFSRNQARTYPDYSPGGQVKHVRVARGAHNDQSVFTKSSVEMQISLLHAATSGMSTLMSLME